MSLIPRPLTDDEARSHLANDHGFHGANDAASRLALTLHANLDHTSASHHHNYVLPAHPPDPDPPPDAVLDRARDAFRRYKK